MTWQTELRALVVRVPQNELSDLVGELSRASVEATVRLTRPAPNGGPPNRLFNAQQAGEYLGVSDKWCYAHKAELGAITLSSGTVRFPLKALDSFIARRPRAEMRHNIWIQQGLWERAEKAALQVSVDEGVSVAELIRRGLEEQVARIEGGK